jgi:hypothetical protein
MLRTAASWMIYFVFMAGLTVVPGISGQQAQDAPAAPVPTGIAAARKVFIANAGADLASQSIFKRAGQPDQAYNHFYSAVQSWGRYELVSTPAEADLVLEIRFAAPMYYDGNTATYEPQFGLNIFDAKTHFLLWSLSEPVAGAWREASWLKNFNQGLNLLMGDLKKVSAPAATTIDPVKK